MRYRIGNRNYPTYKLRKSFRKKRRQHDAMLVLNMWDFNFEGGWNRILNPIKARESN